jgi:hypothetical protein
MDISPGVLENIRDRNRGVFVRVNVRVGGPAGVMTDGTKIEVGIASGTRISHGRDACGAKTMGENINGIFPA